MPSIDRIASIRSKITRANQHIQDFDIARKAFFGSNPYSIGTKEDTKTGKRTYYLTSVDPVPEEITSIAVDAIHNLRTALDRLAFHLEAVSLGSEPQHKVYFPIADSAKKYPTHRQGCIKSSPQAVLDAIDATEPYKGGKGHAIWQLHRLDIADKHKILIADAYVRAVDMSHLVRESLSQPATRGNLAKMGITDPSKIPIPPLFIGEAGGNVGLNVGDEVFGDTLQFKSQKQLNAAFDISFNYPGVVEREPAIKTMQDMTNLVSEIVTSFAAYLK